jgi:hypothetical protein
MSPLSGKGDPLIKVANLYPEPASKLIGHVCTDQTARDVSPIRVGPFDPPEPDVSATSDEPVSHQPIQVELQSVLQAHTVALSRHLGPPARLRVRIVAVVFHQVRRLHPILD